jgi:hypothetical protein
MCSRARRLGDFARDGRGTKSTSPTTSPSASPAITSNGPKRKPGESHWGSRGSYPRAGAVPLWKRD